MNPAITSSTPQILSSASRSTDSSGKSWESPSFRLSDSLQEETRIASKTETIFNPTSEKNENNVETHHEVMSRLRGSSRHRTSSSAGGSQHSIRPSKHPSQKAILSKALQKANTAVLLDNAQNFEVAKQAYSEACALLERVMLRSSGDDDRKKLEAIRNTYISRISEIEKISSPISNHGKALPARPDLSLVNSNDSNLMDPDYDEEDGEDKEFVSTTITEPKFSTHQTRSIFSSQLPPRRESLHQQSLETSLHRSGLNRGRSQRKFSKNFSNDHEAETESQISLSNYSPQRSLSPTKQVDLNSQQKNSFLEDFGSDISNNSYLDGHSRMLSGDSLSWLDTIDESGRSTTPSLPSRASSVKFPRKISHSANPGADAEFDAALDAAVEAAYDESFILPDDFCEDDMATSLKEGDELSAGKLLLSDVVDPKQKIHDFEQLRLSQQQCDFIDDHDPDYYEEDEQMLEEITKDYIMDDFEFGLQSKSTLPRESDSSGFSGRTWASSIVSNPTTASTITSTTSRTCLSSQAPFLNLNIPLDDYLSSSLPPQQEISSPLSPNFYTNQQLPLEPVSPDTNNRRHSGYIYNQIPLEKEVNFATEFSEMSPAMNTSKSPNNTTAASSKVEESKHAQSQKPSSSSQRPLLLQLPLKEMTSFMETGSSDILPELSSIPVQNISNDTSDVQNHQSGSSTLLPTKTSIRKNFSSSSLRNLRKRHVTSSNYEGGSDISPGVSLNVQYHGRIEESTTQPAMPSLPTPLTMSFREKQSMNQSGNIYILNNDIQNPNSPQQLPSPDGKLPISLEPCPNEPFLRPFWLLRALYNTITHSKGGYLSNKLFVPCDAWRVKGVKLKNIEDKISTCDMVTAALSKISRIDILEIDGIMEEMQKFEDTIEQAQISLSKKLGNEVGPPHGILREGGTEGDTENTSATQKSSNTSVKSSFSWRRLRSKNSGLGLSQNYSSKQHTDGKKDSFQMASLPMTPNSTMKIRFPRRDLSQMNYTGPNANYMNSLARLFDAAQIIDQIARQIEDPALRRADKPLAGLESSIRHASEFFSFYICRFVINDIGLLLDKFVKKGGEWVLE